MQPFKHRLSGREIWPELKSFGICFLTVILLVVGAFALVYARNQFRGQPVQQPWAYSHYPSDYAP